MIKAVIFDAGGVLHQQDPGRISSDIAAYFGISREEVTSELHSLVPLIGSGEITEEGFWRQFKQHLNLTKPLPAESLLLTGLRATHQTDHAMLGYVQELRRQGLKVAVLSNTIKVHADYLRAAKLYDGFDVTVLSHEVGLRKPGPQIYEYTLKQLGVSPAEAVFIDDDSANAEAAQSLGMHGICYRGDIDQLKKAISALH